LLYIELSVPLAPGCKTVFRVVNGCKIMVGLLGNFMPDNNSKSLMYFDEKGLPTCLTFEVLQTALRRATGDGGLKLGDIIGFAADVVQGASQPTSQSTGLEARHTRLSRPPARCRSRVDDDRHR